MYAVIETGGKQYRVQKGERLRIEKLEAESGAKVSFPVLLVSDGSAVKVGAPHVAGAQVTATVHGDEMGEKLTDLMATLATPGLLSPGQDDDALF